MKPSLLLSYVSESAIPRKEILEECHRQAILTIGTATTRDEAIALVQAGVDVVVACGFEFGDIGIAAVTQVFRFEWSLRGKAHPKLWSINSPRIVSEPY